MAMLLVLSLAAAASLQTPGQVEGAQQPPQRASAETAARTASQSTGTGRDRVICRRQTRIGTLSGFETVCHTAAEWQALARGTGQSWQQIQGALGSTHGREGAGTICRPNGVGC
jgi:hypothetical protein